MKAGNQLYPYRYFSSKVILFNKKLAAFLFIAMFVVGCISNSRAAIQYFYPTTSANWNTANWTTACATGTMSAWTNGNDASICAGKTCTLASSSISAGTITVAGTLVINAGYSLSCTNLVMAGGTLNIAGGTLIVSGNVSGATGIITANTSLGNLQIGGICSFSGTFTPATFLTVTYNGGVSQSIPALSSSYYNLSTATSGIKSISGAVIVTNSLSVGSGTTLEKIFISWIFSSNSPGLIFSISGPVSTL